MRWSEIIRECGGKTVKGVNTTVDVQPGEIARQAAKFGNKVDANGLPPVWTGLGHKTGAKDTPNKGDPVYGADGTNPKKNRPIVESVSDGERFVGGNRGLQRAIKKGSARLPFSRSDPEGFSP